MDIANQFGRIILILKLIIIIGFILITSSRINKYKLIRTRVFRMIAMIVVISTFFLVPFTLIEYSSPFDPNVGLAYGGVDLIKKENQSLKLGTGVLIEDIHSNQDSVYDIVVSSKPLEIELKLNKAPSDVVIEYENKNNFKREKVDLKGKIIDKNILSKSINSNEIDFKIPSGNILLSSIIEFDIDGEKKVKSLLDEFDFKSGVLTREKTLKYNIEKGAILRNSSLEFYIQEHENPSLTGITGNFIYNLSEHSRECYNCTDCNLAINASSPGEKVLLGNSMNTSSSCLVVPNGNQDLQIDCQGFSILGNNSHMGISIFDDGIGLKNCSLQNFSIGINITNSQSTNMTDINFSNNILDIYLENTQNTVINLSNFSLKYKNQNGFFEPLTLILDIQTSHFENNILLNDKSIKIDSTVNPGLNTSANITFYNVTFDYPKTIVDFEDDGSFIDCSSSICNNLSFNNLTNTYKINVTHFTTYKLRNDSTDIECGLFNEGNSNSYYTLKKDLVHAGNCFTFENINNITLDCKNHSISGTSLTTLVLFDNTTDIKLLNCNLFSVGTPLRVEDSYGSMIENITINSGTFGVMVYNIIKNTFRNIFMDGLNSEAIYGGNIFNSTFQKINIINTDSRAFRINNVYNTLFENMTLTNNRGGAIYFEKNAVNNTIRNSFFINNSWFTLAFDEDDSLVGTYDNNATGNRIYNNYFKSIGGDIFLIEAPAQILNTDKNCSQTNIMGGQCIGGNYWANKDGDGFSEFCFDFDVDGICDAAYNYTYNGIADNYPLASTKKSISRCTVLNESNTYYILNQSVVDNSKFCFLYDNVVNVTLNCMGHKVSNGSFSVAGVFFNNTNSSNLLNCKINNFLEGIALTLNLSNNSFNNIQVINSTLHGFTGSQLSSSYFNNLTFENTGFESIFGFGWERNYLSNISIKYGSGAGNVRLSYSKHNTFDGFTFINNSFSDMLFEGTTTNNTIKNSYFYKNGVSITFFEDSPILYPENNTVYNNYFMNYGPGNYLFVSLNRTNYFNVEKNCSKTNLLGGQCIGGNFFGRSDNTGLSQTCTDSNYDGVCDLPYNNTFANVFDNFPLSIVFHCNNALKDYDETGVDCGGVCEQCPDNSGSSNGGGSSSIVWNYPVVNKSNEPIVDSNNSEEEVFVFNDNISNISENNLNTENIVNNSILDDDDESVYSSSSNKPEYVYVQDSISKEENNFIMILINEKIVYETNEIGLISFNIEPFVKEELKNCDEDFCDIRIKVKSKGFDIYDSFSKLDYYFNEESKINVNGKKHTEGVYDIKDILNYNCNGDDCKFNLKIDSNSNYKINKFDIKYMENPKLTNVEDFFKDSCESYPCQLPLVMRTKVNSTISLSDLKIEK